MCIFAQTTYKCPHITWGPPVEDLRCEQFSRRGNAGPRCRLIGNPATNSEAVGIEVAHEDDYCLKDNCFLECLRKWKADIEALDEKYVQLGSRFHEVEFRDPGVWSATTMHVRHLLERSFCPTPSARSSVLEEEQPELAKNIRRAHHAVRQLDDPGVPSAEYIMSWLDTLRELNRGIQRAISEIDESMEWLRAKHAASPMEPIPEELSAGIDALLRAEGLSTARRWVACLRFPISTFLEDASLTERCEYVFAGTSLEGMFRTYYPDQYQTSYGLAKMVWADISTKS